MRRLERLLLTLVIGATPPIVGLLAGWWGTVSLLPDRGVAVAALAGFAAGLMIDLVFLRRWIAGAHSAPLWAWAAAYLVYSIGTFGFFMGMPVFNLLLAVPAGFLFGGRLARERISPDHVRRMARRASAFTTGVLAAACLTSAALALADPYTAANLEGMFSLPFDVTTPMILGVIVAGGAALLAAQAWAIHATILWSHARLSTEA